MKLEQLSLAHYRGFEQLDIAFEDDITLIAGVNGVGKTGILRAIATAASYALPKFTPSQETPQSLLVTDIYTGKSGLTLTSQIQLPDGSVHVDITRKSPLPESRVEELNEKRDALRFSFRETAKASKEANDIEEEIRRIGLLLEKPEDIANIRVIPDGSEGDPESYCADSRGAPNQPVIVLYSTNRFLSRLPPVLPKSKRIDLAAAYSKALDQLEVSLNDFANWYRVLAEEDTKKKSLKKKVVAQLENAISAFIPGMGGLQLHPAPPPRFSVKKENNRFYLDQLSDGERGLIALVFDLVRRLAIANPESKNPVEEGSAVVMIDEVELHLHPKWQRDVLSRLRTVFPNCQFIVTTHSPMVLGESEARCVRFLEFLDGKVIATTPHEAYGMDANRVLQELMGAPIRSREIETRLVELFEAVDREEFDRARSMIAELSGKLGAHEPELTRASSLIHFLEGKE